MRLLSKKVSLIMVRLLRVDDDVLHPPDGQRPVAVALQLQWQHAAQQAQEGDRVLFGLPFEVVRRCDPCLPWSQPSKWYPSEVASSGGRQLTLARYADARAKAGWRAIFVGGRQARFLPPGEGVQIGETMKSLERAVSCAIALVLLPLRHMRTLSQRWTRLARRLCHAGNRRPALKTPPLH